MDSTAVREIAKLANAEQNLNENFVVLYGDQKLESLERFKLQPRHFKAKFTTSLLDDFIDYLNENAKVDFTELFVDHTNGKAKAIIDLVIGEIPGWGHHTAHLELKRTPEYLAIVESANRDFSQVDFIDFVEDWEECFRFFDDSGDPMDGKKALAMLRKLKIDTTKTSEREVGNYAQSASAMEKMEISANNELPPASFNFVFVPYESFVEVSLHCKLRAFATGKENEVKKTSLKYRIIGLEALKDEIANELVDKLKTGLREPITTYRGTMTYQQ